MPDRINRAQAHKPAEQQVVVELLQQQPLGADPIERLQQRGRQHLLWRNRWAAFQGIQLAEGGIQSIQSPIRQLANPPERMAGRDPLLDRDVGEQEAAALLLASHQRMGSCPILAEVAGFFSELLTPALRSRPLKKATVVAFGMLFITPSPTNSSKERLSFT